MSDPVLQAWRAAGAPAAPSPTGSGRCGRCLSRGPLTPVADVVSNKFTGGSDWADPDATGLCEACRWAYRTRSLRALPHLLEQDPLQLRVLTEGQVQAYLARGALGATELVTLPLSKRKHCLPTAAWGCISADGVAVRWSEADAHRLEAVFALRRAGVAAARLSEPAPPWVVIQRAEPQQRAVVMEHWQALAPWRHAHLWLDVAIAVTHPNPKAPS